MPHHLADLFDPDAKLPRTATLGDALHEAYASLYFALVDNDVPATKELIERELPRRVFELAVDAGWIPDPSDVHQRSASPLTKREIVELGRFTVERSYRDNFLWLLDDALINAAFDLDGAEKKRRTLPSHTTSDERRRLETEYRSKNPDPDTRKPLQAKELCARAGITYRSLKRWRQGPDVILDRNSVSKNLMMLFLYDTRRDRRRGPR